MPRNRLVALACGLLCFVDCAGSTSGGGTQTNWLSCRTNDDCPSTQICVERLCRDRDLEDAGGTGGDTGTMQQGDAGPRSDAATACEPYEPRTYEQGAGRCTRPPESAPAYCTNACREQAGSPGPEECPPSVRHDFGSPCCVTGLCGFDDGSGCEISVELSDETIVAASPCSASSTTPERIYEGTFDRVRLAKDRIVIGMLNGLTGSVTHLSKATCSTTTKAIPTVWDVAATDEATYVIGSEVEAGPSEVLSVASGGLVAKVPLASLFDAYALYPHHLVALGTSVYVLVGVQESEDSSDRQALVELPCCGAPVRIVADELTAWEPISMALTLARFGTDDSNLVFVGLDPTLDRSRGHAAGVFDLQTNQAAVLFDYSPGQFQAFTVADGRLYLGSGNAIVAVGIEDCSTTTIVTRPTAQAITALTLYGENLFWAEGYAFVAGARVFSRGTDGTVTQLAELRDSVDWIGADADDVYFTIRPESGTTSALARRRWR